MSDNGVLDMGSFTITGPIELEGFGGVSTSGSMANSKDWSGLCRPPNYP